jgi:hypothetical protein
MCLDDGFVMMVAVMMVVMLCLQASRHSPPTAFRLRISEPCIAAGAAKKGGAGGKFTWGKAGPDDGVGCPLGGKAVAALHAATACCGHCMRLLHACMQLRTANSRPALTDPSPCLHQTPTARSRLSPAWPAAASTPTTPTMTRTRSARWCCRWGLGGAVAGRGARMFGGWDVWGVGWCCMWELGLLSWCGVFGGLWVCGVSGCRCAAWGCGAGEADDLRTCTRSPAQSPTPPPSPHPNPPDYHNQPIQNPTFHYLIQCPQSAQSSRIREEVVAYKREIATICEEYFSSGDIQV